MVIAKQMWLLSQTECFLFHVDELNRQSFMPVETAFTVTAAQEDDVKVWVGATGSHPALATDSLLYSLFQYLAFVQDFQPTLIRSSLASPKNM